MMNLWGQSRGLLSFMTMALRRWPVLTGPRDLNNTIVSLADPQYGFDEYHATTMDNPLRQKGLRSGIKNVWLLRRAQFQAELKERQRSAGLRPGISRRVRRLVGRRVFQPAKKAARSRLTDFISCPLQHRFRGYRHGPKSGTHNDATSEKFFALDSAFRWHAAFHPGLGHRANRGRLFRNLAADRVFALSKNWPEAAAPAAARQARSSRTRIRGRVLLHEAAAT